MKRKSPETTSSRTPRAGSGLPPWEMVAETSASPPEHTAGAQLPPWVAVGITTMSLATVPGRTVRVAVATGAVAESRTVSVTVVSSTTLAGITVMVWALPVSEPLTCTTAWLLELRKYEPVPPLIVKVVGIPEYRIAVAGRIVIRFGSLTGVGPETPPLPHAAASIASTSASAGRARAPGVAKAEKVTRLPEFVV